MAALDGDGEGQREGSTRARAPRLIDYGRGKYDGGRRPGAAAAANVGPGPGVVADGGAVRYADGRQALVVLQELFHGRRVYENVSYDNYRYKFHTHRWIRLIVCTLVNGLELGEMAGVWTHEHSRERDQEEGTIGRWRKHYRDMMPDIRDSGWWRTASAACLCSTTGAGWCRRRCWAVC